MELHKLKQLLDQQLLYTKLFQKLEFEFQKLKILEDDIAFSLSALGIRIIAPIPGKGTIGIEVPNKNPTMVSMKCVISSAKFQQSEMELPIAIRKNNFK